jgi:CRISPR-associated exonuclease Cas4
MMAPRLLLAAILLGLAGLVLVIRAARARWSRGLGLGETVALDDVTLFSERLRLVGRPDRIERKGKTLIPEEWKSSKKAQPWHEAQLGVYFVLIEEAYGVRPPYGVLVTGDGVRHRIKNTERLRQRVLGIAEEIREHRRTLDEEIRVSPQAWQCRVCGQRSRCRQARG